MTVFVFGNPDLPVDALPLKLLPRLRSDFPEVSFEVKDPNEDWEVPRHLVVIDTVLGLETVQRFDSLQPFVTSPRVSIHDFDALAQLRLLQKVGKLETVTVIGVPPKLSDNEAFAAISRNLLEMKK